MNIAKVIQALTVTIRNLILGGNLLSLIKSPKRMIGYVSENLFLYKVLNAKRSIPQKNVWEVLRAEDVEDIKLGNLRSGGAWFGPISSYTADIVSLCLICRILKPKIVFEIGTMRGYTAFHFALNTPDDCRIYTLDLPKDRGVNPVLKTTVMDDKHIKSYLKGERYCFEGADVASKIVLLFGDSATFDFSPYWDKVDFFFIDGAHSYEYVRSDTLNALRCCHPGSVIA